jgi:hypothetical protein
MNTPPGKGTTTVKPIESTANHDSISETGLSALLGGLLRVKESGPSSIRPPSLASVLALATTLGALTLISTPALALRVHTFSASFGNEGSGDGDFKEPSGVAVNEVMLGDVGDVYVVDTGNNRVERFSAEGAYLSQFNGGSTPAKEFSSPRAIAVDNSGNGLDPANGDVYVADTGHGVIDKFTSEGVYLGQLTERSGGAPFGELHGVAVDREGNVWVSEGGGNVDEFSDTGSPVATFSTGRRTEPGLAVDSNDDVYVVFGSTAVGKLDSTSGAELAEFSSNVTDLAIDAATNHLFVDRASSIAEYGHFGEPFSTPVDVFPSEGFSASRGLTVNATTGTVYATQYEADTVEIFPEAIVPTVTTEAATNLKTEGAAMLNGTVNPEGIPVTSCEFEYGPSTSYGATVGCSPSPGSGSAPVVVSADVTGLAAGTYHYRLVAGNANGENPGQDRTFVAAARPGITGESVSAVGAATATAGAQINPGGSPTVYRVEYGTSTSYGSVTSKASVGAGFEAAGVQVHLSGLQPGTVYHFRFVATNELGVVPGSDLTFTTAPASGPSAATLPDHRAYEDVSLSDGGDGEVFFPFTGHERETRHQIGTSDPVRASADGNAVAYAAEPPPAGGSGSTGDGGGNVFIATRGTNGWNPRDLMPPVTRRELFQGFSSDLSLAFLHVFEKSLTSDAPPGCEVLYSQSTSDGAFHAAFTTTETPGKCGGPRFAGVSADRSSVVFESEARLTPEATEGNMEGPETDTFNLYDLVGGHLYLVNVLPGGEPDVNAAVGGVTQAEEEFSGAASQSPGYHHYGQAIAADGSHIVWTDLNTGDLYVRENPASPSASTVLVATEAYFRGASSDGSKVLYTKGGDLYEYDLDVEATHDLTLGGAVLGVLGSSKDASIVYFVAEGVLAGDENANGEKAIAGQLNLYALVGATTRFIATLSPEDNAMEGAGTASKGPVDGDWRTGFNTRTAEVTPDGRGVVFMSRRSITGYDNQGGCLSPQSTAAGCPEVFTYDANTSELSCTSCNPTGAPPTIATVGSGVDGRRIGGAFLPTPNTFEPSSTYQLRTISDDGSRVFFDTAEPLVPQDTNGVQDVYEWERAGSGTCREAKGCVYLLSGGLSHEEAVMVDASASGDDLFFTTRAQLVPQDENGLVDLYDARVGGGFPHVSTACTGTGCQGVPPAPPTFATPSSVTFRGAGNFPAPLAVKPVVKSLTRAQKLAKALKTCRTRPKRRRASCERRARKQYALKSKSKLYKGGK